VKAVGKDELVVDIDFVGHAFVMSYPHNRLERVRQMKGLTVRQPNECSQIKIKSAAGLFNLLTHERRDLR